MRGVEFPSPRRLTARAMSGVWKLAPEEDPWQPARAVWPLLKVMEVARGEEWLSVLWSYLGASPGRRADDGGLTEVRGDRRWSIAHHLTGLFAGYASSRPTMIASWLSGHDSDGLGQPLTRPRVAGGVMAAATGANRRGKPWRSGFPAVPPSWRIHLAAQICPAGYRSSAPPGSTLISC